MSTDPGTPPKYNPSILAQVILEEAVELHPECLTARQLLLRIIADPDDRREVETAMQAIRDLRHSGLFISGDDNEIVKLTPAALHAVELLS